MFQGRPPQPGARVREGKRIRRCIGERCELRDAVNAGEPLRRLLGQGQVRHPRRIPQEQIRRQGTYSNVKTSDC